MVTSKTEQESRLLALADVDFGDVYSADGAGDGTLTYQGEILKSAAANLKPDARVKAIVGVGSICRPTLDRGLGRYSAYANYVRG